MISKESLAWYEKDEREYRRKAALPAYSKIRNKKMRELRASGMTYTEIGSQFGLSKARVRNILVKYKE